MFKRVARNEQEYGSMSWVEDADIATGVGLKERISTNFSLYKYPLLAQVGGGDVRFREIFHKHLHRMYDNQGNELPVR